VLVLAVLALLVFGVVHLLGGSSPAPRPTAAPVASPSSGPTPSQTVPAVPVVTPAGTAGTGPAKPGRRHRHQPTPTPTPTPLAVPTGPCSNSDVLVSPAVPKAYAGSDVTINLDLTTRTSPACTWEVSPQTVVVALSSGTDRIWSSQDCPGAIGQHSVIVRKEAVTKVSLVWGGRRSAGGCARNTLWAQPGWYHVQAAAYGAGPTDEQFHLLRPPRATVTVTPKPHKKHGSPEATPATPSTSPTPSAAASPSPTATAD
jgi:hypothetical protein